MYLERIWCSPFILERPEGLLTEEESIELAYAFMLAESERASDETLEAISRLLFPLVVLPVDEDNGLVLDGSGLFSSRIDITPLNLEYPLRDLETDDFKSFVSVLGKCVKLARAQFLSKPKAVSLAGWVGEDFAADVRSLLPKFREVTNVKESGVIEPLIRTDDKVFLSVTKWFPKASIVSEAGEKQDSLFRIVDSRIQSMETKLSEMKRDFRERESELRAEAQQKIESERENMRERLKRAEQEAFSKDFPQPLSSLETHARIISDKLNSIRSAAYSKDMDKIFETIQEAGKALREAERSIEEIEREYLKYQKEMEKFYKQREREIAAVEAEFQKREKKIRREPQEKIDKMQEEIDQFEELIVRANQLREEITSLFDTWKENMEKEIGYARGLTIPLRHFGDRTEAFPIYLPFFVIKYQRNRKAQYHIVPPLIPRPESKVLYESPATLEELAVKYERNLKKGKLFTKIELGLRENNVLESPEKTQKLQRGISLLESSLHVDSSLVETVREAYEKRFEKSISEG
ncbi:MAG: hypothetical protein ACTSWF_13980 [Candidatus Freyarchaeota archaeon]